jgi:hypothetical protein
MSLPFHLAKKTPGERPQGAGAAPPASVRHANRSQT